MKGKGIAFALLAALVSGISVYVNSSAVRGFDPFTYTTLKNIAVAVFLSCSFLAFANRSELSRISRKQAAYLLAIGLLGGGLAFLLFFQGLSLASAAGSSFLYRLLFIPAAAIAAIAFREKISLPIALGALAALAGNFLLLNNSALSLGTGELLVLAATLLWAVEYNISKKALEGLSSKTVALARMGIGSIALLAFLAATSRLEPIASLSALHWQWVAISSFFLIFFVSLWYEALKHAPVTQATAAFTLGGPVTYFLSLAFLAKPLLPQEALGMLLLAGGLSLIIGFTNFTQAARFLANALHIQRLFPCKTE